MLGRDERVDRQQYSQQRLATKDKPYHLITAATMHIQAGLKFQALHVLRGTRMMRYNGVLSAQYQQQTQFCRHKKSLAKPATIRREVWVKAKLSELGTLCIR